MSISAPVRVTTRTVFAGDLLQRRVDIGLERNALAAAQALVGGDDDLRSRILDAAGERLGREAAEHHRMDGADARAGEHGEGGLGDHRQIDGDAVASLDAVLLEHIGEAADLFVQFGVSDVARDRRIVAFPDDRGLVGARRQMPVDAIHRDIGRAVLEPAYRDVMRVEARVLDAGERRDPGQPAALLGPKTLRVGQRARVELVVGGGVDRGPRRPILRDGVNLVVHWRFLQPALSPVFS